MSNARSSSSSNSSSEKGHAGGCSGTGGGASWFPNGCHLSPRNFGCRRAPKTTLLIIVCLLCFARTVANFFSILPRRCWWRCGVRVKPGRSSKRPSNRAPRRSRSVEFPRHRACKERPSVKIHTLLAQRMHCPIPGVVCSWYYRPCCVRVDRQLRQFYSPVALCPSFSCFSRFLEDVGCGCFCSVKRC